MKKIYLFGALGGLMFASCANDDLVVKPVQSTNESLAAITFDGRMDNMSRSASQLEEVMDNFGVWAFKADKDGDLNGIDLETSALVVMKNYKVEHKLLSSYGSDWSYVLESPKQYLKYWDGAYAKTYFFPYGPFDPEYTSLSITAGTATMSFPVFTMNTDKAKAFIYGDTQVETNALHIANTSSNTTSSPKEVPIKFNRLFSQLQIAIYEDIPGYKVKLNTITFKDSETGNIVAIPADCTTDATPVWSRGNIVNKTTPVVDYSAAGFATKTVKYTKSAKSDANIDFALVSTNVDANGCIADYNAGAFTPKTGASYSETVWNIVPVDPVSGHDFSITDASDADIKCTNSGLQFVVNYTLYSVDTKETITVKDARVYVPAAYTQWQKDHLYTYIFRITKNSSGTTVPGDDTNPTDDPIEPTPCLYPIIFDDVTIEDLIEKDDEFVITGLVMNQTTGKIFPDETLKLTVSGINIPTPPDVTWKTSNAAIATVANGVVTPVKLGTVVISAEGRVEGKPYIATCVVTIKILEVYTNSLSLTVGESKYISYKLASAASLTWKSANATVASVDTSGKVTAEGEGSTTIKATATWNGETTVINIPVTVTAAP